MGSRIAVSLALTGALLVSASARADDRCPDSHHSLVRRGAESHEVARELTRATRTAISPLLVMALSGIGDYWNATPAERACLPWYSRPTFWLIGLSLILIVLFAQYLPQPLKHVGRSVQVVENKVSLVIASPVTLMSLAALTGESVRALSAVWPTIIGTAHAAPAAGALPSPPSVALLLGVALLGWGVFAAVWLTSHAFHVLATILPIPFLGTGIKLARNGILLLLLLASWLHPYLGPAFALVIIVVSILAAGWAFRLSVFGAVFTWDLLTLRSRQAPSADGVLAFASKGLPGIKLRTIGRLRRAPTGDLQFTWRPWLVLSRRAAPLDPDPTHHVIGRGLSHPILLSGSGPDDRAITLRLAPRYRHAEAVIARELGVAGVEDVGLRRAWNWARERWAPSGAAAVKHRVSG